MDLYAAETQLLEHPLFAWQISPVLQLGLPWLQLNEERLVVGYSLHRQCYRKGQLWFYPVQWELQTPYPFHQISYLMKKNLPGELPICHVASETMLTLGKSLLQELYGSADRLIALWEEGKARPENFGDYQRQYRFTVKHLGLDAIYGG